MLVVLGGLAVVGLFLLSLMTVHFFPSTKNYHASVGNALMRVEAISCPGVNTLWKRENMRASKNTIKESHQRPGTLTGRT